MAEINYTPEEYKKKIAEYFKGCFKSTKSGDAVTIHQVEPFDVASLALYLGIDLKTFKKLREQRGELGDLTREAFNTVEGYLNKKLITSGRTAGIQFYLKEHFGYDKKVIDINIMHQWSDAELDAQIRLALEALAQAGEIDRDIIELVSSGGQDPTFEMSPRKGHPRKPKAIEHTIPGDRPAKKGAVS